MSDVDVVVIGSGAGGLTAAVALANAGQRVLVLEQHDVPGGWCHSFTLGGHRFSPGVHYVGEMHKEGRLRAMWEGLGLGADLVMCELNRDGFDRFEIGGERFDVPSGFENQIRNLQDRFPQERAAVRRYFDNIVSLNAAFEGMGSTTNLVDKARRGVRVLREGLLDSIEQSYDRAGIESPRLRAVLGAQSGDHGMPPSQIPAIVHSGMIAHYFEGGWYPRGGGFTIPRAYVRALKRAKGEIRLQTAVEQILVENGRAVGVRLKGGEVIRAKHVISNADPHATFGKLMRREDLPLSVRFRLRRTRYSTSALSLFFATDIDVRAAGMTSANVWLYPDGDVDGAYRKGQTAWDLEREKDLPGMFLTCTTLKDPSKKHGESHTCESFTFVHHDAFIRWAKTKFGERTPDYAAMKESLMDRMFQGLEQIVPGISQRVTFRDLGTPLTNDHYVAATQGNLYGTEKSRWQVGPFGWQVAGHMAGLFLTGASTLSHGVMGACISGLFAAREILGGRVSDLFRKNQPEIVCVPSEHPEQWPESLRPRAHAAAKKPAELPADESSPSAMAALAASSAAAAVRAEAS